MTKKLRATGLLGLAEVSENAKLYRALAAEFVGTFLLVLIGCASIITISDPPSIVGISLTFGLLVASIVQAIAHVSGGHINPAVTVSMFITGDVKMIRAFFYIIVQCLGSIAASGVLLVAVPEKFQGSLGATFLNEEITLGQGILFEGVLTFLLVFVVHSVCDSKRGDLKGSAPLAIGLAVVACHLSGIKYTGSSINPARSLGPVVMLNDWEDFWVYWAGPIAGGAAAGLLYKYIFKVKDEDDPNA